VHDRLQTDALHDRAICMEIGERLHQALARNEAELPASLESRLDKLREQDEDHSPSIVPSMDH
jgi:hypothetical protein